MPEGEDPAEDYALWRVVHDDGNTEDLEEHEVKDGIRAADSSVMLSPVKRKVVKPAPALAAERAAAAAIEAAIKGGGSDSAARPVGKENTPPEKKEHQKGSSSKQKAPLSPGDTVILHLSLTAIDHSLGNYIRILLALLSLLSK